MSDSPNVFVVDHPIIRTKLTELRAFETASRQFRDLLDEVAMLMTYEVNAIFRSRPASCAHRWNSRRAMSSPER